MNKFIISGRLTADPDVRYTQNEGKPVFKFTLAVDRSVKVDGQAEADFFQCIAFGKIAESCTKCQIVKGTKLLIEAEMRNNNYTDRNGTKHYECQAVVQRFEFCEPKKNTATTNQNGEYQEANDFDDSLPWGE